MKTKFKFTLSGFIIAMILVSMISVGFAMFLGELVTEYDIQDSNVSIVKYNFTDDIVDGYYLKLIGGVMTGGVNYTNGISRYLPDSSLVVYDTDDEAHLLDADLTRFDELRSNVFTVPLDINTR